MASYQDSVTKFLASQLGNRDGSMPTNTTVGLDTGLGAASSAGKAAVKNADQARVDGTYFDPTAAETTNAAGHYNSLAATLYHGGRLNSQQWGAVGQFNAGASGQYNGALNGNVANLDKQITDIQRYAGTPAYDAAKLKDLQTQRAQANVGRWASVTDWSNPGMQQLKQALDSGQISWQDLGDNFDINEVGDPAALAQHLTQFTKDKIATPTPPVDAPDPAADAGADAAASVKDSLAGVGDHVNSLLDAPLAKFDQQVGQKGNEIESQSNPLARQIGGEDAGAISNSAGANLAANSAAARDNLKADSLSNVNDYISSALEKGIDQNMDLASLDSTQKLQVQKEGLTGLMTELQHNVDMSDAGAKAQVDKINAAIQEFTTKNLSEQERSSMIKTIIGMAAGVVMAGAGAAAAATGVGAPAAPFLVAGGLGQIARNT